MKYPASSSPRGCPSIPNYTLVEQLYLGSRTAVYRAVQKTQQLPVVIKVLRREYPSFGELLQFRNQFTIAKNLPIAGIIKPISLEPLDRSYALVMEDWGGMALSQYAQQQPLELTEVLAIALQLAEILHDLVQHRVVHKDIKPANILIHPDTGEVKLIDFSIASLLPKETQEVQNPNVLEGTLAYLAPEQTGRMNRGIDYRADFYSLGVTLYELLAGKLPFESDDPMELVHCHLAKAPTPADQVNPEIPRMVAAIVAKLMAKNAEDRYQSAMGLQHDLQQCLTYWQTMGTIPDFELGQRDLSDRFLIPEKLYGREAEVKGLLNAFERVAQGASELMLVAGFSGIGKTAVINEVHKPIVRQRGYFIKGKFDQFNRSVPLSAFVQALRALMCQLLSESDDQLTQWRSQILSALGENGQVLIEVIPELEQIIGPQSPAPALSGSAAQNRFNLLFQRFIEVFTTAEHPLVLFLDDLQWADLASLQLLKLLMDDSGYLLILGAYRDNEVSPTHPFMLAVQELQKEQATVTTITLAPLAFKDTNYLIADTLNCSQDLTRPLTEIINPKTQGNPFFITQFLKALYEDGHISFNYDQRCWVCNIAEVKALSLTDDVMEFMALKLQKLPSATQQVLKLAAYIGNQFDLETLAIVSERSLNDAAMALWKAVQEGMILPTSQVYKFFQGTTPIDTQKSVNLTYRFLHDRIQQAAYLLVSENQQQATHLKIGKLLLNEASQEKQEEKVFDIVNHLNKGAELISVQQERNQLAELNLKAGEKALISTAYAAAAEYFNIGINLLSADSWQSQYSLTFSLYESAVKAEYLNVNFAKARTLASQALNYTPHLLDRVKLHELQIQIQMAQAEMPQALEIGLSALELLGVELNQTPQSSEIQLPTPTQIDSCPEMTDAHQIAVMRILMGIFPPAYTTQPELLPKIVLTMIELSLQRGHTSLTAFAYVFYGLLLCGFERDLDKGYRSGWLALKVLEQFPDKELECRVNNLFNVFIRPWKQPLINTVKPLVRASQIGFETGDTEYASYATAHGCTYSFLAGEPLLEVQQKQKIALEVLLTTQQDHALYNAKVWQQLVSNLLGNVVQPKRLCGENFNETELLPAFCAGNDQSLPFSTYLAKCILSYSFEDYPSAVASAMDAAKYAPAAIGVTVAIHNFYYSLSLLAQWQGVLSSENDCGSILGQDSQPLLDQVDLNQKCMKEWATHAPANFEHKYSLVEAEKARVCHQWAIALEMYDRAIIQAKANGYQQEEALANELAAKFYLNWGKEKLAASYMQEAYYGYAHWGARAKIRDLERRYPNLLAPILQQQHTSLSTTETVFAPDSIPLPQVSGTHSSTSGSSSISATLDLATVLKASQALSSEIHLDKLLIMLLHTVLENAGADKGALLMPNENQWFVEAVATLDHPARIEPRLLSQSQELPLTLIHTVSRTRQPVVIVDATAHSTLAVDAYVTQRQPKSLLCTPILQQGKFVAILYLENHLTIGAFTSDRVELLNLLCVQAAISLENARLYQQAQDYAQQLEQSQLQVVQSEKMATLGNLVAGVAHEINNPVGFLNGSIKNAKEYTRDLIEYLAIYQQNQPPTASVQESAEEIDLDFLLEDLPKLLDSMQGATHRIKAISNSLRTFSRADTEYKVNANLHEGIDSTLLILKYRLKANEQRPAIQVIKEYGALPGICCFPGQLNQVFMNILANAIDMFDEVAQQSTFDALKDNPQTITIHTALTEHSTVEIRIGDNGKGMTDEVKAKVFDHLFTTKGVGKGTGLGLAIAQQIVVEKHRGQLEVHSVLDQGTEFCIRLPICVE